MIPNEAKTLKQTPISRAEFGFVRQIIKSANPSEFSGSGFLKIKIPILERIATIPALMIEPLKPVSAIKSRIINEDISAEDR